MRSARRSTTAPSIRVSPARRPPHIRPTAESCWRPISFDFDGDLYGRKIEVALHAFIRDEQKFDDVDALVAKMRNDEAQARRLLALRLTRHCEQSPRRCGNQLGFGFAFARNDERFAIPPAPPLRPRR